MRHPVMLSPFAVILSEAKDLRSSLFGVNSAKHLCSSLWAAGEKETALILRFAQDDSYSLFTIHHSVMHDS
jgi:hypothetical protein